MLELAHSIGRMKDEYEDVSDSVNTSETGNLETIQWKKLLGFGGVGITLHGYHAEKYYIPTPYCNMLTLENSNFCEVCKLHIARRLNSTMFTQKPDKYYVAYPDVTIEHGNATGETYKSSHIYNGNIHKANNHDLEFRTIDQNFSKTEQHVKLLFKITDINGEEKISKEEIFTISPLINEFHMDDALHSISITFEKINILRPGDKIIAQVIDNDTQEIITEYRGINVVFSKININHKLLEADGSITDIPNVLTTTLYAQKDSVYNLKTPVKINGLRYISNSAGTSQIKLNQNNIDIDFYYAASDNISANPSLSADKTMVDITPHNLPLGSVVTLAFYNGGQITYVKTFTFDGGKISHPVDKKATYAKVMVWESLASIAPLCDPSELSIY